MANNQTRYLISLRNKDSSLKWNYYHYLNCGHLNVVSVCLLVAILLIYLWHYAWLMNTCSLVVKYRGQAILMQFNGIMIWNKEIFIWLYSASFMTKCFSVHVDRIQHCLSVWCWIVSAPDKGLKAACSNGKASEWIWYLGKLSIRKISWTRVALLDLRAKLIGCYVGVLSGMKAVWISLRLWCIQLLHSL